MKRALALVGAALLGIPAGRPAPEEPVDWRPGPHSAAFAVRYGAEVTRYRIASFTVLPGERVELEATTRAGGLTVTAAASGGQLAARGAGRWSWRAPERPGLHSLRLVSESPRDSILLQAFVAVPRSRVKEGGLNGYLIGRYPRWSAGDLEIRRPPRGFIEVTRDLVGVPVSPRFRLGQFLCKQEGGFPKYLVLDERMLLKLEFLADRAQEEGIPAEAFHIMSGYRTPAYNRSLGNVGFSRHLWGAAADIFVDADGDGWMDDLNGDGRVDKGDAAVLYELVDRQTEDPAYRRFVGGLAQYGSTASHGPFIHLDVRGGLRARW